MLDHIPIESIDEARLSTLVRDQAPESPTLDFKQDLPGSSEKERKHFLADVTAMANTAGGTLLFGVEELRTDDGRHTGRAGQLRGLQALAEDTLLGLEQIILQGTSPPVQGCRFHPVRLGDGTEVLVLRIPRSWAAPHAVILGGGFRFYARGTRRNYPLDVPELRNAFLRSEHIAEKIRRFRFDRVIEIRGRETPLPVVPGPLALIHVIPFSTFARGHSVPASRLLECRDHLLPPWGGADACLVTAEGLFAYATNSVPGHAASYALLFRDGPVEYIDTQCFRGRDDTRSFYVSQFSERAIECVRRAMGLLQRLNVSLPLSLAFSVLDAKGSAVVGTQADSYYTHAIHRHEVHTPDLVLDSWEIDVPTFLKPALDVLWNAGGWIQSHPTARP